MHDIITLEKYVYAKIYYAKTQHKSKNKIHLFTASNNMKTKLSCVTCQLGCHSN